MRYLFALLVLGFAGVSCCTAQLGVYGLGTTSKLTTANTPRLYGGTFGVYYDSQHFPVVNFGIDVRGAVLPARNSTSLTLVTAGPRAVIHLPLIPIRPYAEITAGGGTVQYGSGGTGSYNSGGFAASATAGADLHVLPYIDWRVIDYSFTRLEGPKANENSISTGIVVRIPSVEWAARGRGAEQIRQHSGWRSSDSLKTSECSFRRSIECNETVRKLQCCCSIIREFFPPVVRRRPGANL